MARPEKGTKGAEEATRKWKETMRRKYGGTDGVHNMMRMIGSKGGQKPSIIRTKCEEVKSLPYDKNPKYTVLSDGNIVLPDGTFAILQKDIRGFLKWQSDFGPLKGVRSEKMHNVIARHFLPNPEKKPFVRHINNDKTDNRVENLEWCDRKEKMDYTPGGIPENKDNQRMNELGGQLLTAVTERYVIKELAKKNKIKEKTIRQRVWEFKPEPITTIGLGRRRKFYYYNEPIEKYCVEETEIYPGKQFDTELKAKRYIQSFYTGGGFAANPELAKKAGAKGGRKSRRTGVTTGQGKEKEYIWKGGDDALVFKK